MRLSPNLLGVLLCAGTLLLSVPLRAGAPESLQEGVALFEKGDQDGAASFFRSRALANARDAWARYYLGRIQFDRNEVDDSVASLTEAVEIQPGNSEFHLWLGRAYLEELSEASTFRRLGLSKRVREHYNTAIELDPDNLEARESLAGYYFEAPSIAGGSKSAGMEQVEAIRGRDPMRARIFLGSYYWGEEEHELARTELEAGLALDKDNPEAYYWLGLLDVSLERWDDAFLRFHRMLELDPGNWRGLYQTGKAASLSGRHLDLGVESLTAYLGHEPTPDEPGLEWAHYRLGLIHEHRKEKDLAIQEYRAALAIDPDHEGARKALKKLS